MRLASGPRLSYLSLSSQADRGNHSSLANKLLQQVELNKTHFTWVLRESKPLVDLDLQR